MGGVGNGVAEEDSLQDLNPGTSSYAGSSQAVLGLERALLTLWLRNQESKM